MNGAEFWSHIKSNMTMASIGAIINFLVGVLPIKKMPSWEVFWIGAINKAIVFTVCIFCGLMVSYLGKTIGLIQYSEALSAMGALGGEKLVIAIQKAIVGYAGSVGNKDTLK
jgi:hypothetical protein